MVVLVHKCGNKKAGTVNDIGATGATSNAGV